MTDNDLDLYVCPECKGKLQKRESVLYCGNCTKNYPVVGDIPDFLLIKPEESKNPFLHGFGRILAPIYESPLWFPVVLKLLGGLDAPSLKDIVRMVRDKISPVEGLVLDVATGTGTYGRHTAGTGRKVCGIDISFEMLRKGKYFTKKEGVQNMNFARADGGTLPFGDKIFDGCLFCGSLHVFPDTVKVLKEVGRTLKSGAMVIVTTLIHGEKGLIKNAPSRPNMKIFDLPDLQKDVYEAGFEKFEPRAFGCLLMFTMFKK